MQMHSLSFDVSHTLAGGLVLISFMMLYQDRLYSLLNVFALHALMLALSVAWQAYVQNAPHLYITAVIALVFKAIVIPVALHRIVKQLGIHRDIESAVGIGPTMLAGMALVALSMVLMLRVTAEADPLAREDLAFALSVVLLGLLVMVTRRNAVSQVVGFMSLENGLVLAATGAKGMPLVVEISVAFSILIAFIVIELRTKHPLLPFSIFRLRTLRGANLAGILTGVVSRPRLLTGAAIREGDYLLGLPSNGLHTTGYSLALKLLLETAHYRPEQYVNELGDKVGAAAAMRAHIELVRDEYEIYAVSV